MGRRFKIVITDCPFPNKEPVYETLAAINAEVILCESVDKQTLKQKCKDADAIIVAYADIDEELINSMAKCKIIARLGIGMNNVNVEAATARGIYATNVRTPQSTDVANHAMVLLLALAKKIVMLNNYVKNGNWDLNIAVPIYKLSHKVLGLAGFGNIGRKVAVRAKSFELNVTCYDPYIPEEVFREYNVRKVGFDELLRQSDYISLHMPLSEETKNLFSKPQFEAMKDTAYIINTSRGGLIDEEALIEALRNRKIAGAGLDVLASEFPDPNHPLYAFENVIITPHSAYYSEECIRDIGVSAAQEVVRVLEGQKPISLVNMEVVGKTAP